MSDDKITPLPVKHRDAVQGRVLTIVKPAYRECQHRRFTVDKRLKDVTCRDCGAALDPMYALIQLATQETEYHQLHERYQDELARLGKRQKTKCEHCGEMTRISHR